MQRLGRIIVRVFALLGVFTLLGLIGAGLLVSSLLSQTEHNLPPGMVLTLDLERQFYETPSANPLDRLDGEGDYDVLDVVKAIDHAAQDDAVKGLFAYVGDAQMGFATAQEIVQAVERFKASGKPALAFSQSMGEGGNGTLSYYLASAFDHIWLQPSGQVGLTGFNVAGVYLREVLDAIGITFQMAKRKEYKSAPETYTQSGSSPEARETYAQLLNGWSAQFIQNVSAARRMDPEQVARVFSTGPWLASEALSMGLVDRLGYEQEAVTFLWGADAELVDVAEYAALSQPSDKGTTIALIRAEGEVVRGVTNPFDDRRIAADTIAQGIREAVKDQEVKAILLRINSPGGSYVASDVVWNEIQQARKAGKPVVASLGDMAASGGYFMAMGADRIIAQSTSITGSIGVFGGKMVANDLLKSIGVNVEEFSTGGNAGMFNPTRPFSDAEWQRLNRMMDAIYADFTAKAGQGRNLTVQEIEDRAKGQVFTGSKALELKLIDELGGYDTAKAALRQLLSLSRDARLKLKSYPEAPSDWELVMRLMGGGIRAVSDLGLVAQNLGKITSILGPIPQGVKIQQQVLQ